MLYLIKSISSFLLPPGIFIVFQIILAIWLYRLNKKAAKILLLMSLAFYLCSTPFIGDSLIRSLESRFTPPSTPAGDVLVMLGGGATLDNPNFDGLGNLSGSGANRLLTTARLYRKTGLPIILSGGQVYKDTGNEAQIAKRQLIGLGVPDSKIILENSSRNTTENAQQTKLILEKKQFKRPILITSAFHMERAVKNFAKVGFTVQPYPADYKVSTGIAFYANKLIPSYNGLFNTGTALREYLALMAL